MSDAHTVSVPMPEHDGLNLRAWFAGFLLWMIGLTAAACFGYNRIELTDSQLGWAVWSFSLYAFYLSLCCGFFPLPTTAAVMFLANELVAEKIGLVGYPWLRVLLPATLGAAATGMANLNEYHVFTFLLRHRGVAKIRHTRLYHTAGRWFGSNPFTVIALFSFIPIPVDVIRWLAITARYPRPRFFAAYFLGRWFRYAVWSLATVGFSLTTAQIMWVQVGLVAVALLRMAPRLVRMMLGKSAEPDMDRLVVAAAGDAAYDDGGVSAVDCRSMPVVPAVAGTHQSSKGGPSERDVGEASMKPSCEKLLGSIVILIAFVSSWGTTACSAGQPTADQPAAGRPAAAAATAKASSGDARVDEVLDRLETKGAAIKGLASKLTYKYVTCQPVEDEQIKEGELLFARSEPNAKFLVRFDKMIAGGVASDRGEYFLFDGRWLTERNDKAKTLIKREIVRAGEKVDPFQIGKGPFPLPFGQKRGEILSNFNVTRVDFAVGDPLNTVHLHCVPLPNVPLAKQYSRVEIYVDKKLELPVRIVTERVSDRNRIEVDFKQIDVAAAPADSRFAVEAPEGFTISLEPLPPLPTATAGDAGAESRRSAP